MPPNARDTARMSLRDLVCIVGVLATGFGIYQMVIRAVFPGWIDYSRWATWLRNGLRASYLSYMFTDAAAPLVPIAASGTLLALLLRWLQNRRAARARSRYRLRTPGTAACIAALIGWVWAMLGLAVTRGIELNLPSQSVPGVAWLWYFFIHQVFPGVGVCVIVAWCMLGVTGRWRRSRDWLDTWGRGMGFLWILIGLIWMVRSYADLL